MTDDEMIARDEMLYGKSFWLTRPDGTRERIDPAHVRFDPVARTYTYTKPARIESVTFTIRCTS